LGHKEKWKVRGRKDRKEKKGKVVRQLEKSMINLGVKLFFEKEKGDLPLFSIERDI